MEQISVTVLYFANVREIIGKSSEIIVGQSGMTSIDLFSLLIEKYPKLVALRDDLSLAVNQTYIDMTNENGVKLSNNDEVAVIPPVSGGWVEVWDKVNILRLVGETFNLQDQSRQRRVYGDMFPMKQTLGEVSYMDLQPSA